MSKKLEIKVYKSDRDGIKKTNLQKDFILPPPGLTLFVGKTGSGKTNVVCNLLQSKMLGDHFDLIYVFCLSPCTMLTDTCKKIEEKNTFTKDDPEKLAEIVEIQKKFIKDNGFKKAPHILFILDDVVQSGSFLRHPVLRELAFAGTHFKASCWISTQSYKAIPRAIRINCHSLILYHGLTDGELDRFAEEHQSAYLNKKDFIKLVKYAIDEPYSFLFVNCTIPNKKKMFRKGFEQILVIP